MDTVLIRPTEDLYLSANYRVVSLNENVLADSSISDLIPLYAEFHIIRTDLVREAYVEKVTDDTHIVALPAIDATISSQKMQYADILYDIVNLTVPTTIYSIKDVSTKIIVCRGCIVDHNGDILFMITYKKGKPVFNPNRDIWPENIVVFVSTEFRNKPEYTNLYKYLNSNYIEKFYEIGCEVRYAKSDIIKSTVFKNSFTVEGNNLEDIVTFANTEGQDLLCYALPQPESEETQELPF